MSSKQTIFPHAIGLFNEAFPPIMDGVAMTVYNYAYWLQKKTGNVRVITPRVPNAVDENDFKVMRYASISTLVRKPYRLGVPYVDVPFLNRLWCNSKFSIVHAHSPFSAGRLGLQVAKRQQVPFVATFHSKFKNDFQRIIKNETLVNFAIKQIVDFYESADEVWIPQATVEETIREYGYKGKLVVMDNGSDFYLDAPIAPVKSAAREKLGVKPNEHTLLFVGQHIWEKNTRLIIEALELLGDFPYKMFFVGGGYAAADMRRMVDERGLNDRVTFAGSIFDREALRDYYAAADLFLFPSIYDNAPLVVREAAALHTPSILANKSTSSEVVRDNVNGFLIENSARALADKIKETLAEPEKLALAGENASRTIARSWEDVTDEVLDRYKQLILRKK